MRVITGSARGMRLTAPEGMDVRPTTDKVKESIFNIIQFDLADAEVLDLFAGSGQLGIEALSRGASRGTFVDSSERSLRFVRENLKKTRLEDRAAVRKSDARQFLSTTRDTFHVALLDPPYRKHILPAILPSLANHMDSDGVIVCETASEEELPSKLPGFSAPREYRYGKIKLTVYRGEGESNNG